MLQIKEKKIYDPFQTLQYDDASIFYLLQKLSYQSSVSHSLLSHEREICMSRKKNSLLDYTYKYTVNF